MENACIVYVGISFKKLHLLSFGNFEVTSKIPKYPDLIKLQNVRTYVAGVKYNF